MKKLRLKKLFKVTEPVNDLNQNQTLPRLTEYFASEAERNCLAKITP